jgi:hypothetical protein
MSETASEGTGGFFTYTDLPTVAELCRRGDVDKAIAFLTLSMGTGKTGLQSYWGTDAIRKRLGVRWKRADQWMTGLERDGFIDWPNKGARRPKIKVKLVETRRMRSGYAAALERIREGTFTANGREERLLEGLIEDGWIERDFTVREQRPFEKAYLPLSLVGDNKGLPIKGPCILERIRRSRDPMAVLLLVEMYAAQDLPEVGGTDPRFCWLEFAEEEVVFQSAKLKILQAHGRKKFMRWCDLTNRHGSSRNQADVNAYFERIAILEDAGALEFVLAVVEESPLDPAVIYPLGVMRHGKLVESQPEHAVGQLAIGASLALRSQSGMVDQWLDYAGQGWLAPVDRQYRKAKIVGIPRLVARPKTTATKRWQAERIELCRQWASYFAGVISEHAPELLGETGRLQRYLNAISTFTQGDLNDRVLSPEHSLAADAARDDEAA